MSSYKEKVIAAIEKRHEFTVDVDGHCYWWPIGIGALTSKHLRVIADELDRRNQRIESSIESYFQNQVSSKKGE